MYEHNVGQLSTSVLELLKVFYNKISDNKTLKHSTDKLKITKSDSRNINTIKQLTKHKQEISTSKLYTTNFNENIQPTTEEYTLVIPVIEDQKNVKLYNKKNKQTHKTKATSLKEDKIDTSVYKL